MKKRLLYLLIVMVSLILSYHAFLHPSYGGIPLSASLEKTGRITFVPLDGRPPCRQFVLDAADIAGTKIDVLPYELQDYYTMPGEKEKAREWLQENLAKSDAAIISIDQLLYGGLLAAREAARSPAEIEAFTAYLRKLHAAHPQVPLYAFSILPRMIPPASIDDYYDNKYLLAYSRLADRYALSGDPADAAKMQELEAKIRPESLAQYLALFEQNERLMRALIELVKEGTLERLLIGQDDGETYSIPNIEKRRLQTLLAEEQLPAEKAVIVHGADELALTLLAAISAKTSSHHPQIFLDWNDDDTAEEILPFMAVSLRETAMEKVAVVGGECTASAASADFVLCISAGSEENLSSRRKSAERIEKYLAAGVPVALVDLSRHFAAEETLLPLLIERGAPIEGLRAYAGWNTASNSVGTALAHAVLFSAAHEKAATRNDVLALHAANLKLLNNRFLEDYFYLKDVITLVNTGLKKNGTKNVYDLDLERDYLAATAMLRKAMDDRLQTFKSAKACRRPIHVRLPDGESAELSVYDLQADMSFPWPRTFEIYLETTPFIAVQ